jgi:2-phospho-L-lactate guanylyltransferase
VRALLVPVKQFASAKVRLASVLSAEERQLLARQLAEGVLAAAAELVPFVVCEDSDVAKWASSLGVGTLMNRHVGLSHAVTAAVSEVARRGYATAVVAHADLARPEGLSTVPLDGAVVLVPDLREDGTNVVSVPTRAGFRFAYGRGSFERHRAEARRLGLLCVTVHDRRLAADVDEADDLRWIHALQLHAPAPAVHASP